MNAPLRDSYSHRLFLSLENFAPGQLEKLGTLQHLGIRVKLHVPPEADLLHAERFRRLSELRVRSRRKLLHPSYPLSALPPGGKLQDDVIVRNELGVMVSFITERVSSRERQNQHSVSPMRLIRPSLRMLGRFSRLV